MGIFINQFVDHTLLSQLTKFLVIQKSECVQFCLILDFLQPPACDVNENKTSNIADALNDLTLNEPASQPTTDTVTVRRDSGMGSPDESETVLLSETDKTIRVTSPSGSSEDSLKHHKIRTDSGCSYGTSDDAHGVKKSKMTTSDRYDFKQITHTGAKLYRVFHI